MRANFASKQCSFMFQPSKPPSQHNCFFEIIHCIVGAHGGVRINTTTHAYIVVICNDRQSKPQYMQLVHREDLKTSQ